MNEDALLKSVFPIALENGDGRVQDFRGTAFLLNYGSFKFVVTAWHCIRNIIKKRYKNWGIINDNTITEDMVRTVIEKHCSFGFTKSDNCWRIPINGVPAVVEKHIGKRLDITLLCIDEESFAKKNDTSLAEIEPLQLSNQNLYIGKKYRIAGYPDAMRDEENKIIRLGWRYLTLIDIEPENVDKLELEQGLLAFESDDTHAKFNGYSGGVVLDDEDGIVGMIIRAPDEEKVVRFITSRMIDRILHQYISENILPLYVD